MTLRRRLISVDTTLSGHLFAVSQHCFPVFLLNFLEYTADYASVVLAFLALILIIPYSAPFRRPFLFPALLGIFLDRILGRLLRRILPRSRPLYGGNMSNGVSVDRNSFPSGHASRVCFIAVLFELSAAEMKGAAAEMWIGRNEGAAVEMVGGVVRVWAVATSFSRVVLGRHHLSDVVAGACLGALEAVFVLNVTKKLLPYVCMRDSSIIF